jgi:hypothetical protein
MTTYVSYSGCYVRWTPPYAVKYALDEVRSRDINYKYLCDKFVARCYGFEGSGYVSAISHWGFVPSAYKHSGYTAPPGAFHFWSIGQYGHVAINVGNGLIASNDIKRWGYIDVVPVGYISQQWGARYLGWTNPYLKAAWGVNNNKPVLPPAPVTSKPVVHVSRVQPGANNSEVLIVQKALRAEPKILLDYSTGPGIFGPRTKEAYAKWQRLLGFTGSDADGKPVITSLRSLGARHSFLAAP